MFEAEGYTKVSTIIMSYLFSIPKNNKEIFLNPSYVEIPGLIGLNREKYLSYNFDINGVPFSKFREQARSETLKKAGEYTDRMLSICSKLNISNNSNHLNLSQDKPIILAGHAPVLAHPGVLIKNSLVSSIAKDVNGIGVNMVVDNDVCHENWLNIPNINELNPTIEKIEFISGQHGRAFEEIIHNGPTQFVELKKKVLNTIHNPEMKKAFSEFIDIVIRLCEETQSLSELFTYARHAYMQRFSINNLEIPVSLLSETGPFLDFFLHIARNIENFVDIYNAKLEEYRKQHKIRSKANPLPDLERKGGVIEMPFWIWRENGQREKLHASVAPNSQVDMVYNNEIIANLDFQSNGASSDNIVKMNNLRNSGIKIRPKAIVNTMYARLFVSDLFIHGIGGAKYDLITDSIVRGFFGIGSPAYAVASATLHLPYKPYDVSPEDDKGLKHAIKDMGHHPGKYATGKNTMDAEMQSMADEKEKLITTEAHNKIERSQIFNRLKQINKLTKEKIKPFIDVKEKELEQIKKKLHYNSIVTNREYPFCIYPETMQREIFSCQDMFC